MPKIAFHQPTYRPISRCGLEELAAHQKTATPSGGILFARKISRPEKDRAREAIASVFNPEAWPGPLSMLVLPGVNWRFESMVLSRREKDWRNDPPKSTRFTGVESDRAVFHAALMRMPGLHRSVLRQLESDNTHERGFTNKFIDGYHFANVDDFMAATTRTFDAAWLDYTGPLSVERLRIIRAFWNTKVTGVLALTSMRARWNRETSEALIRAGSLSALVRKYIHGDVVHEIEYQDGHAPMFQIMLRKPPT